ncbi:hypothetical protein [Cupriavidus necator]|uniref:hypothetical protein n=1 Tax=Cupriavidus necator TaxID=106590 RepID=UPI00339D8BA9
MKVIDPTAIEQPNMEIIDPTEIEQITLTKGVVIEGLYRRQATTLTVPRTLAHDLVRRGLAVVVTGG